MARFVNDQAVLRRGDGPFRPFGGAPTLRGLLFPASEPGFTFEPWDITTLYQDRAGTTPVTAAGQSVGLRLDKSQGLRIGPELVTNGDFAAGNTGWTRSLPSWNATSGVMINDGTNTSTTASVQQAGVVSAGKTYRIVFDLVCTSGSANLWLAASQLVKANISTSGRVSFTVLASVTGSLFFEANISSVVSIDNISVRELPGNHQVAVSDAKRGVYGWMPKTGRRNLLTYTEQFDNAAWAKSATVTVTSNSATSPIGDMTADTVSFSGNFQSLVGSTTTSISGLVVTGSIYIKGVTGETITIAAGGIDELFTLNGQWQRLSLTKTAITDTINAFNINTFGGATARVINIWGAQLETGSTATAYQRVVSQYDITEAGVPTCYYVQADGVDDAYVTPTITPNTDKVQVFAGVRKLSDAAVAMLIEMSADHSSMAGSFNLVAPLIGATGNYGFSSRGSALQSFASASGYAAPITNVITGLGDISGDSTRLRINGTQVAQVTTDQGTGNFLAYPAYIYARGGTSLPFNGLDFGHAVRFGPNLDAAAIARVEALIARNTPEVDFLFGGVWTDQYNWDDETNWNDGA